MKSKRIGKGIMVLVIVLVGALLVGCSAPPAAPPTAAPAARELPKPTPAPKTPEKVKFAVVDRSAPFTNFFVGAQKGVFKDEGVDLELRTMATQLVVVGLTSGEIEYEGTAGTAFVAALQGVPVKALMYTLSKPIWHLHGAPGTTSVEQLKGKSIGTFSIGGGWHYVTREVLRAKGIDPDKDVAAYVAIPSGVNLLAALKSGNLAGTLLSQPFSVMATDQGMKELAYSGELVGYPLDGVATTNKKLKENPDQVKRVLKGTLKSLNYIREHPEDAIEWLMKEAGAADRRVAEASYNDIAKVLTKDGLYTPELIKHMMESGKFSGALKGNEDPMRGIDQTLLKEALKELGLSR